MTGTYYFGIDLGTSHSSIAYVVDDPRQRDSTIIRVQAVPIPRGRGETSARFPSIVAKNVDDRRRVKAWIGWEVFEALGLALGPRRRTSELLRRHHTLLASVKSEMGMYGVFGRAFSAEFNTPAKVSARILASLLDAAREHLDGADPRKARVVITVPASFSVAARAETLAAARLAGLRDELVELIDEPVAALIDLLNDPKAAALLDPKRLRHLLVFDWGGGTCDLALLRARFDRASRTGLHVENLAISQYRRLGGDDVDAEVMSKVVWPQVQNAEKLSPEIRRRVEDTLTPLVARRLKEAISQEVGRALRECGGDWERLRRRRVKAEIPLARLFTEAHLPTRFSITSAEFEQVMAPFLAPLGQVPGRPRSLLEPVSETLRKAGMPPEALDVLVLHGGSCRNPYVQRLMTETFASTSSLFTATVVQTPDLDASVAYGAALASYWKHARAEQIVRPIMAEELGVVSRDGITGEERHVRIAVAGTPLPYPGEDRVQLADETFYVARDDQPELVVPFYTANPPHLGGVVKVPVAPGTRQGAHVRIKLAVRADKTLRWWFSVDDGPDVEARFIADPWSADLPSPELRQLLDYRRGMRATVEAGGDVTTEARLEEATLAYRAGRLDEALERVGDVLEEDSASAEGWNLKGLITGLMGQRWVSLEAHRKAAEIDWGNAVYRGNYGCALFAAGQDEQAIGAIRSALDSNTELTYLYLWLGDVYRKRGDEDTALREFRRAETLAIGETRRWPRWREAWRRRVSAHRRLGRYEEADEAERQLNRIERGEHYQGDVDNMMSSL